mgnify:CR=1 FL=1
MAEFIVTFGPDHAERSGEPWRDSKGYAVLESSSLLEAIHGAAKVFGEHYSMVRLPREISEDDLRRFFPRGEIARVTSPAPGLWTVKVH